MNDFLKKYDYIVFLNAHIVGGEIINFSFVRADNEFELLNHEIFYLKQDVFSFDRKTCNSLDNFYCEKIRKGLSLTAFLDKIKEIMKEKTLFIGEINNGGLFDLLKKLLEYGEKINIFDGFDFIDFTNLKGLNITFTNDINFYEMGYEEDIIPLYEMVEISTKIIEKFDVDNLVQKIDFSKDNKIIDELKKEQSKIWFSEKIRRDGYVIVDFVENLQLLRARKYDYRCYKIDEFEMKYSILDKEILKTAFIKFCSNKNNYILTNDFFPKETMKKLNEIFGEDLHFKFADIYESFGSLPSGEFDSDNNSDIEKINMGFVDILKSLGRLKH